MAESSGGDKFLCFIAGAGIGAVLALLFAPKSGRETRDFLAKTATDSKDYVSNKYSEGRQFVGDTAVGAKLAAVQKADPGPEALFCAPPVDGYHARRSHQRKHRQGGAQHCA